MNHNERLAAALLAFETADRAASAACAAQDDNRDTEVACELDAAVIAACTAMNGPRAELEAAVAAWASAVGKGGEVGETFGSLVEPARRWRDAADARIAEENDESRMPDPRFEIESECAFDALVSAALATPRDGPPSNCQRPTLGRC